MVLFGHIGIGRKLVGPLRARLPAVALIVGTLLPDIIDKPLYYARLSSFISCTRTFGHSGLFVLTLFGLAYVRRSRMLTALAAGAATHVLLDCVIDWPNPGQVGSAWTALTWPFIRTHFALYYIPSVRDHLENLWSWPLVAGEIVGLLLIGWELWQRNVTGATAATIAPPAARQKGSTL